MQFSDSLSLYLTESINCKYDDILDFPHLECLSGACKNSCKLKSETIPDFSITNPASYYVFETIETVSYNKSGEAFTYKRTGRVNKKATLSVIFWLLQDCARKYVIHRFFVISDHCFWHKFRESYKEIILKIDYSENIQSGVLVLRSDNYSSQFKSKYTFANLMSLAEKYDILIVWFYGEPGHGRGLVDAMSSFGCKAPLRSVILTQDKWFHNASEMKSYLTELFHDDHTRKYFIIDAASNASKRKQERDEFVINGCHQMPMISVSPDDTFSTRTILDSEARKLLKLEFDVDDEENNQDDIDVAADTLFNCSDDEIIKNDVLFDIITPGTFVDLRTPSERLEMFYIVKVTSKNIADGTMTDNYGHCVLHRERFIEGVYLQKDMETKKHVKYNILSKPVFIHLKK